MLNGPIIHHTALAESGGAARIAILLMNGLENAGIEIRHSFEASEKPDDPLIPPRQAASAIPGNSTVHLHSSADPAAFLDSLPESTEIFMTMHDARMITGGCLSPQDCPRFEQECLDPCPRNYPNSGTVRSRNIAALLNCNAKLISPSKWLAGLTCKAHKKLKPRIIPNGIPWPEQPGNKIEARKSIGLNPGARVVLFVAHGGMQASHKSGPQWPDYWKRIKKNVPEAIAFAIGGKNNSRHGDFFTLPYLDHDTLNRFMLAADVLAYPTLADNHPLIVLEAMSNGLVPVSYEVGGVSEQIINHENGILIPPYEKEKFSDTVSALLLDRHTAQKMASNAFHKGRPRFNSMRMVSDYIKFYGIKV